LQNSLTSPWIEIARELTVVAVNLASPRTPFTLPLLQTDFANDETFAALSRI